MSEQLIKASDFKARCLSLLDEVAQRRTEIVVTKHGKPVARVVPIAEPASTDRSVTLLVDDDELYFSTGAVWDAAR